MADVSNDKNPSQAGKSVGTAAKDTHPLVCKSEKVWKADVFENTDFDKDYNDYHWLHEEEPHIIRRKKIMKDHPEIRQLFGHEPLTAVLVLLVSAVQFSFLPWIGSAPRWLYWLCTYVISGTLTHTSQLLNHEISHNLCFGAANIKANLAIGIFANLCTGVPSSVAFRYYHYEHHLYQGVLGTDTDIPSKIELMMFRNFFTKCIFVFLMPFFYGVRPLIVKPRSPTVPQVVNFVVQMAFNAYVINTYGFWAFGYLLFGALLGMGFHPCAGHFIAEHFEFVKGFETYSYYGSCNFFNVMVGLHNEHHDFPRIPWSRLHKVREIAPEYYQHLPKHHSYIRVFWHFLTDNTIGPWSRVARHHKKRK